MRAFFDILKKNVSNNPGYLLTNAFVQSMYFLTTEPDSGEQQDFFSLGIASVLLHQFLMSFCYSDEGKI